MTATISMNSIAWTNTKKHDMFITFKDTSDSHNMKYNIVLFHINTDIYVLFQF